jgi:hypothetical protein
VHLLVLCMKISQDVKKKTESKNVRRNYHTITCVSDKSSGQANIREM